MIDYSSPRMKHAYAIAIMLDEEAYDLAKQFIDHLQQKQMKEIKHEAKPKEKQKPEAETEPEIEPVIIKEDPRPREKPSMKQGRKPKYLKKLIDEYKDLEKHPWIDLTPTIFYRVKEGWLQIAHRTSSGKFVIYGSYEYDKVKEVYDLLPDRSTKVDVIEACKKAGLKIHDSLVTYLMRIFSRYIDFDAEITKEGRGNKLVLVKNQPHSLAEENRKKLKIEAETIGQPWKVEG